MRVWKLGKRVPLRRFHIRLNCEPKPEVSTLLSSNEITSDESRKPMMVSLSRDIHTNKYLFAESDLVSIKSGYGFEIGISTTGRLFGRGVNSSGQLSSQVTSNGNNIDLCPDFVPIWLPCDNQTYSQVACGRQHFAGLTSDGEYINLVGSNHAGQLGSRPHYRGHDHHKIHSRTYFGSDVLKIECGLDHTLILLTNGRVATFGLGADGQLGHGNLENRFKPALIELENVIDIHSNGDWNLALTQDNKLYGWGNNEYRQISSDEIDQISEPTLIQLDGMATIKNIATGANMGAILTDENKVFSWGYGMFQDELIQHLEPNSPRRLDLGFEDGAEILGLTSGLNSFGLIMNNGVKVWGKNENNMFDRLDQIDSVDSISIGLDNITILGQVKPEFENPKDATLLEEQINEGISNTVDEIIERDSIEIEAEPEINDNKQTQRGYQGRNFDPNYSKNRSRSKPDIDPVKEAYLKGKFGKKYDPTIAAKMSKKKTSERQEFKTSPEKEAYLKGKFGANYDPSKVGRKGAKTSKAFEMPSAKGYKGKNYDPDYLKKKLGDKYDPSRAPRG